jgi:hypothetical protein
LDSSFRFSSTFSARRINRVRWREECRTIQKEIVLNNNKKNHHLHQSRQKGEQHDCNTYLRACAALHWCAARAPSQSAASPQTPTNSPLCIPWPGTNVNSKANRRQSLCSTQTNILEKKTEQKKTYLVDFGRQDLVHVAAQTSFQGPHSTGQVFVLHSHAFPCLYIVVGKKKTPVEIGQLVYLYHNKTLHSKHVATPLAPRYYTANMTLHSKHQMQHPNYQDTPQVNMKPTAFFRSAATTHNHWA